MPAKECPSNRVDELASESEGKWAKPKKLSSSMSFYVGAASQMINQENPSQVCQLLGF